MLADALDDGLVATQLDVHHLGDGLTRDVVLRGSESAAHDDGVGAPSATQRGHDAPRLSPTFVWKCESMPASASRSPIHDELVSTTWPSSSSVPTATTHTARRTHLGPIERAPYVGRPQVHRGREHDRDPQQAVATATWRRAVSGSNAKPTASSWTTVFTLASLLRRHGDARRARPRSVHADADLASGDDHHRHPPEHVTADEREHRAEHQHLVGQRIEEGARPCRAVTAGDVAVEAVAGAQHDPEHERRPRPPLSSGIIPNTSGAISSRPIVTALAGVASARRVDQLASSLRRPSHGTRLGDQVGPSASTISTVGELADRQFVAHLDDAVDLGGLAVACGRRPARRRAPRPSSRSARRGGAAVMSSCSSVSSARRSAISAGRHLAVELGGVRAVLAAVGEEAAPVELGLLDEARAAGRGRARSRPGSRR